MLKLSENFEYKIKLDSVFFTKKFSCYLCYDAIYCNESNTVVSVQFCETWLIDWHFQVSYEGWQAPSLALLLLFLISGPGLGAWPNCWVSAKFLHTPILRVISPPPGHEYMFFYL